MVVGARKAGAKMRGARSDHEVMSSDRVTHHRVTLIARGNDCLVRYRILRACVSPAGAPLLVVRATTHLLRAASSPPARRPTVVLAPL